MIVSVVPGATSDSEITTDDEVLVSWAVKNRGDTATGTTFVSDLQLDGQSIDLLIPPGPLAPQSYALRQNVPLRGISEGVHTLKVIVDSLSLVTETSENDNVYERTFNVIRLTDPRVTLGQPITFGEVQVGSASEAELVVQHVVGSRPASGTVTVEGEGFTLLDSGAFSLEKGAAASFRVRFAPVATGSYSGTAKIEPPGLALGTVSALLSGVGTTITPKTYTLSIDADGGNVTIIPQLPAYPHGGSVTVRISPNAGRIFAQWEGTFQSVEQSLTFLMTSDVSLTARLRSLVQPFAMRTANSTPATLFDIVYPTTDGYIYVLEFSTNKIHWRPLTVTTGQTATDAVYKISTTTGNEGYYRIRQRVSYHIDGGFLHFPIINNTSSSAPVTSVVDHHGVSSYLKDGAILTCKGQLATVDRFAYGYRSQDTTILERMSDLEQSLNYFRTFYLAAYGKDDSGSDFNLPFNYNDDTTITSGAKGLLFYDGHPGYDYKYVKGTDIRASAEGRLIPGLCGGVNNQIAIQHLNGYRTFYLHCDRWAEFIQTAWSNNQEVEISAGRAIGTVGDRGSPGAYHLHFEVHRYSAEDGGYVVADPYGFYASDGSQIDPPLWITGE